MTIDATDWLGGASAPPPPAPGGRPAKDHRGRQRKLLCGSCGFICYATAGAIERAGGLPSCACGSQLEVPNLRDRLAIEPDAVERELFDAGAAEAFARGASAVEAENAGRVRWNEAMREIGASALILPPPAKRDASAPPQRCQWDQGYCMKFVSSRYCPEHDPHESARRARACQRGV